MGLLMYAVLYRILSIGMKIKQIILSICFLVGVCCVLVAPKAMAADCGGKPLLTGQTCCGTGEDGRPMVAGQKCCNGVVNSFIDCGDGEGITTLIDIVKVILTACIGIGAIGGIIYAAILYTTSGGSADNTKKAMTIIRDVIIGVVAFALMYALLNFIGIKTS